MMKMIVTMAPTSKIASRIRLLFVNRTTLHANRVRNVCQSLGFVMAIMTVLMVATKKTVIRRTGMFNFENKSIPSYLTTQIRTITDHSQF